MKLPFTNFSKGEIAPQLYSRIDTAQYQAGAKRVRNFIIQRYGGLSFRPGFRFVGEANNITNEIRYIPFQYNIEQAYIMALENYEMNILARGGFVLEEDLQIISVTQEAQAILEVNYHAWAVGDRMYLNGVTGMTELNNRFVTIVEVIDAHHVRIDVDTTDFAAFVSSTGTNRVGAPPAPPAPPASPPPPPPPPPPASTGGGGGDDLGGDPFCIAADSWLPSGVQAFESSVGDMVEILDYATMAGTMAGSITAIAFSKEECVEIESESGIKLIVSTSTPVTLMDGSMPNIMDVVGRALPVLDDLGFRWERIVSIHKIGTRPVARISANDATYAAGKEKGRYIFTHNMAKSVP